MSQLSTISIPGTQAKCSSRPTTVQKSRLLDLPGELWNRIYDLAIQDLEEAASENRAWRFEMRPPSDISKCALDPDLDPLPFPSMATSNWSDFNRAYLGLSQTCHTLRTEFLPLHNAVTQATSCIDLPNATAYTETFILPYATGAETTLDVLIGAEGTYRIDSLLDLLRRLPELKLRHPLHMVPAEKSDIQALCIMCASSAWAAYYHKCVSGVEVQVTWNRKSWLDEVCIYILVKKDFGEAWMSWAPRYWQDYQSGLWEWQEELGLDGIITPDVLPRLA
jgi:hypothetical protein